MQYLKRKKFSTEFVEPPIEAEYRQNSDAEYMRSEAPTLRAGLVILLLAIIYFCVRDLLNNQLIFFSGLASLVIPMLFGAFFDKLPYQLQNQTISACMIPIAIMAPSIWIHNISTENGLSAYGIGIVFTTILATGSAINTGPWKRALGNISGCLIFSYSLYLHSKPQLSAIFRDLLPHLIGATAFITVFSIKRDLDKREIFALNRRVKEIMDELIPPQVSNQMLATNIPYGVHQIQSTSILFADLVGFTRLSRNTKSSDLANILNDLFSRFDMLADLTGVEKIKTIGDSYMCTSGVLEAREDHAYRIANMALEMREGIKRYRYLTGIDLHIRIGIHSGPVLAGVLGKSRYQFDVWGDTVNFASRLESGAPVDGILVSEQTQILLAKHYKFSKPLNSHFKGIGDCDAYVLLNPLDHTQDSLSVSA